MSNQFNDVFVLSEWHMYGSSRLGIQKPVSMDSHAVPNFVGIASAGTGRELVHIEFNGSWSSYEVNYADTSNTTVTTYQMSYEYYSLTRGEKNYEMTNHLGNVLAVISDKKLKTCTGDTVNYYIADVLQANDYYAFHATMSGRTYTADTTNKYRFGGSNGQEKDDEVFAGAFSAEYWEYDSRSGRRWNVDPVMKDWQSVYSSFGNNPIFMIDLNGDNEGDFYDKEGNHLGSDGINDDKVYVTTKETVTTSTSTADNKTDWEAVKKSQNTTDITTKYGYTHSQLLQGAAMAYNEGENTFEGRNAIVNVLKNRQNKWHKSFDEVMGSLAGSKVGKTHEKRMLHKLFKRYASFFNEGIEGRDNNSVMKSCIAASIQAMTGGKDYSNGALYWHGNDFFIEGWPANDNERVPKGFKWDKNATIKGVLKSYMKEGVGPDTGTVSNSQEYVGVAYYGKNVFMIYKP